MMNKIQTVAESLLPVRFAECGRDLASGLDCVGLFIEFFRRLDGREIKCPLSWKTEDFEAGFFRDQFVRVDDPRDGDVARMGERHLGIKVGRKVLHAHETCGVVIQRMAVKEWYRPA